MAVDYVKTGVEPNFKTLCMSNTELPQTIDSVLHYVGIMDQPLSKTCTEL
jgi:hypothetical protein